MLNDKDALAVIKLPPLGMMPYETYGQLTNSLIALFDAAEDIFARAEKRLAEERGKLKGFTDRIDACHQRVKALEGSTAATVIYSPAR